MGVHVCQLKGESVGQEEERKRLTKEGMKEGKGPGERGERREETLTCAPSHHSTGCP